MQQRCWHELTGTPARRRACPCWTSASCGRTDLDLLRKRFNEEAIAVLTPIAVDPAHPFPFIPNKGIGVVLELDRGKGETL